MSEAKSQYQRRKEIDDLVKGMDKRTRTAVLEKLLEDWVKTLPERAKPYLDKGADTDYAKRLKWLQEHWGTEVRDKETNEVLGVRKAPMSGVLQLLAVWALNITDSDASDPSFGDLEDGSELSDKVVTALAQLKYNSGPTVQVSKAAYNELQRIRQEYLAMGGEVDVRTSTKVIAQLGNILNSLPAVKSDEEQAKYEKQRKTVKKPSGTTAG